MKKISLVFVLSFIAFAASLAQGTLGKGGKQLNAGVGFSGYGVPVYIGADFGVHESITIGPRVSHRTWNRSFTGFKYKQNLTVISFNGNYHFNQLLDLDSPWDLYAGLTLGYYIWSGDEYVGAKASGIGFDAQIGARYFFSDRFGVNLEFGGGYASGGIFGITYKF